jgi:choline dehydrogenase-like flavoprotein
MATLKPVDAVMIGFGWTGGILANERAKAGHTVVGLERGEYRNTDPDFAIPGVHDELAYAIRYKVFQDASKETLTFRHNRTETALPIRQFGALLPCDGLGGAGVHWNGVLRTNSKVLRIDLDSTKKKARLRDRRQLVSAERRLQPHRNGRCPRLSHRGCGAEQVSEEPRSSRVTKGEQSNSES